MSDALFLPDEAATGALAAALAGVLPDAPRGWSILLEGELGAGKSTFARAMLRAFGHTGAVPSPTYTLVEPYEFPQFQAFHIDLYRISSPDELEFLGFDDYGDGLTLIEWPDRVRGLEDDADILVALEYADQGRRARIRGLSERAKDAVAELGTP